MSMSLLGYRNQRFQLTRDVSLAANRYVGLASATWRMQIRPVVDSPTVLLDFMTGGSPQSPALTAIYSADAKTVSFRGPTSIVAAKVPAGTAYFDFGFVLPGSDFERVDGGTIEFSGGVTFANIPGTTSTPANSDDTVVVSSDGIASGDLAALAASIAILQPFALPFLDAYRQLGDPDDSAAFARGFAVTTRLYGTPGKIYTVSGVMLDGRQFDGRGCVVRDAQGAPFAFRLQGFRPMLRDVQFQDQGHVAYVTSNTGGFAIAATGLTVASSTGFAQGQQVLVQGNSNLWMQTQVGAVSGSSVTMAYPTSEAGTAGLAVVASWGLVHLTDSAHAVIEDLLFVNTRVGMIVSTMGGEGANGVIRNIQFDGARYCAFAKYGDVHDINISDMEGFCGATDVFTYNGGGVPGAFDVVYPVDLIRNVTVTVNGAPQTYGVHYTFVSEFILTFLSGHYPPFGTGNVGVTHYHSGVRGFIEDQRGATVAGGNQMKAVRFLNCLVAMELRSVTLSDYLSVILDTNMLIGLLLIDCGFDCNFQQLSSTWARQPIVAINSSRIALNNLTTNVTPGDQVLSFLPSGGSEIISDATSHLAVGLTEWESPTYTTGGAGLVNLFGGQKTNFGSASSVPGGSTVYLTSFGQAPITFPAEIADKNGFLVTFYAALDVAPGAGQNVVINIVRNAGGGGAVTLASTTISNGGFGGLVAVVPIAVSTGDLISVQAIYSSGAAASSPRGYFVFR